MRLHELFEAQWDTPAARSIEKLAQKNGYHRIGDGWDSTVWIKGGSNEVVKILMPEGKHAYAKNAFLAFYSYCQYNQGNPHLPKFSTPRTFPVGAVNFMFVTMERLQSLDRFYGELVHLLGDLSGMNADWYQTEEELNVYYNDEGVELAENELNRIRGFYETLLDIRNSPEGEGFVWDMHEGNAMFRGNTLVVIDPWVYDTRVR
jgi:hypothetical protein